MQIEANIDIETILVIEDNPINLKVIIDYLEEYELEILTARHGEEGIEKALYAQPDLILLDVMLPGIDGFETCRRLKRDETTQNIPIIFMTALSDEDNKIQGFEAGGVDYITKPIQQREMMARVTAHLRIQKQANQLAQTNQALAQKIKELDIMQEQLVRQEKLAALGRLANGVANELRNPIAVISNAVFLLKTLADDPDSLNNEYLDIIATCTRETEKLADNLLDFSQTRAPIPSTVSVETLVKAALKEEPPPEHIELIIDLPADLPNLFVDPIQIKQVIMNLITNAYRAMPETGRLTISATVIEAKIELSIIDTGIGMTPGTQEKIFEPLFTTKAKGIGLGLPLSKSLVTVNDGQIEVKSTIGAGSKVNLSLPIQHAK